MPLPHIKRRCTATCRATQERCKNPAAYGMATCRYHGARKPESVRRGEEHPHFSHGRFAQLTRRKYHEDMRKLHEIQQLVHNSGLSRKPVRHGRPPKDRFFQVPPVSICTLLSSTESSLKEASQVDTKKIMEEMERSRLASPLPSGIYKLVENFGYCNSWCEEVDRIGDYNPKTGYGRFAFRHCTSDSWHIWLTGRPTSIVKLIGFNILPAIDALAGDGVPPSKIEEIRRNEVPKIERLIADIDGLPRIHATRERKAIRNDTSVVKEIVVRTRDIVGSVLCQTCDWRPLIDITHVLPKG